MCPSTGFLQSNVPLLPDAELKLSFDRTPMDMSFIKIKEPMTSVDYLELKDCYLLAEYISSPSLKTCFNKKKISQ